MLNYFLTASLVTLLTHLYFAARLVPGLAPGSRWRRRICLILLGNFFWLPGALVLTLYAPRQAAGWAVPLAHMAFTGVGFCILLTAGLLLRDAAWAAGRLLFWIGASHRPAEPQLVQRRRALLHGLNVAMGGAAGAATVFGYAVAQAQPVIRRVRIACPRLPPSFPASGLRIVQVSDLHIGPTIRRGYVEALCQTINSLAADLVVITGDLVDGYVSQLREQVAPLGGLRARHGVYFVTGNHEYFYRAAQWCRELSALGLHVLENQHVVLEHAGARIFLAGINDPSAAAQTEPERRAALTPLLNTAKDAAVRILLAHRPSDAALGQGMDLQLSGHLHGGQFFPLTVLVHATEPYSAGLYRVGDLWLYVNRGAGYWGPPNRLGARQELTLLELIPPPGPVASSAIPSR